MPCWVKGWDLIVANAVDPEMAFLRVHVDRDLPQPLLVLAEHLGHAGNCEDEGDAGHR